MHIQIQCCGIVLMMVLLYFYTRQKKMLLRTEKAFRREFFMTLICIILDVFSIEVIENRDRLPELFVKFIAKSYLITLLGTALFALLYMYVDIYTKQEIYKKIVKKYKIIAGITTILVYILPIYYRYDKDNETVLNTYGLGVYLTFAISLSYFAVIFYLLRTKKERINPIRREAVWAWMAIWIMAATIEVVSGNLLIVGYAGAIGIMVFYLKIENPETNLDRQTGLFNHGALIQYATQLYNREQKFSVLVIILDRNFYKNVQYDINNDINRRGIAITEITEYLLKIPDAFVFKNSEDEILLLFEKQETAEKWKEILRKRFETGWGKDWILLRPYWLYIPNSDVVNNTEELLYLIRYIRQNNREFSENYYLYVDAKMAEEMYQEKETEQLILNAIEKDWVEVYYQPIYSTKEQRITAAEALVRIQDEQGRIIPPGYFIEVAEKNGMILRLGEMVFEKVCRFIHENPLEKYGLHYIEVNLSVVQGSYEQLSEDYIQIMEKYNIDPKYINLEITESASMTAKKILLDNMKNLINYGVSFSLDDFGTGQSNLNYIVDMPVDIVKFDRSMTVAYFENGKAKYVMDAAMHMVHGMNLEIVSEGVETEEQYQTMKQLGISYIQGYYFSQPLSAGKFLEFVVSG